MYLIMREHCDNALLYVCVGMRRSVRSVEEMLCTISPSSGTSSGCWWWWAYCRWASSCPWTSLETYWVSVRYSSVKSGQGNSDRSLHSGELMVPWNEILGAHRNVSWFYWWETMLSCSVVNQKVNTFCPTCVYPTNLIEFSELWGC